MIGDKIRELRKQAKMTQVQLSKKLGISSSAVGMYEQNRRDPSYDMILKLGQIFSVTTDYLLGSQEETLESPVQYQTKVNDLAELINNFKTGLTKQKGLMFKGQVLTQDDLEKILQAIEVGTEVALMKSSIKEKE